MNKFNTTSPSHQFFELSWDIKHLYDGDIDYDVWMEKGDSWYLQGIYDPHPLITLPENTEFEGWEFLLKNSDYPYNRERFPIMSQRMLDVLLGVKDFPHQAISIEIEDVKAIWSESEKDYVRSGIINRDYVLVQLLEHQDIFDFEKSEYTRSDASPKFARHVRQLYVREPEDGFPPLFRVSAMLSTILFVSEEAKAALQAADIKGIDLD